MLAHRMTALSAWLSTVNMLAKVMLFLKLLLSITAAPDELQMINDSYGPWALKNLTFEPCKGKEGIGASKEYAEYAMKIENGTTIVYNMTVHKACALNKKPSKVRLNIIRDAKKTVLKYDIRNPCEYFPISSFFKDLKIKRNCVVEKGSYVTKFEVLKAMHEYIGDSFFYSSFESKSLVHCDVSVINCVVAHGTFERK